MGRSFTQQQQSHARGSMGGGRERRQQGGAGEERMGWLSAVAIGAITPGLNRPTLVLMNIILVGLLLSFAALLPAAWRYSRPPVGDSSSSGTGSGSTVEGGSSEMLYHVLFLLLLTLLLIALLNWLAWEVGTVSTHSQARQLLAPAGSSHGAADAPNESGAHDAQEDTSGSRRVHGKRHKKKRQGSKKNFKGRR